MRAAGDDRPEQLRNSHQHTRAKDGIVSLGHFLTLSIFLPNSREDKQMAHVLDNEEDSQSGSPYLNIPRLCKLKLRAL
jgi:hypothetical protein